MRRSRCTPIPRVIRCTWQGSCHRGAPPPSCANLAGDLIGAVHSGRSDLATNSRVLDEAVVQDSRRAAAEGHR